MLDLFNIPSKTKADVQFFYRNAVWTKPRGASFIYMMLIGGGGNGSIGNGGGSGAVTRWMGSAVNVPDNLVVNISTGNASNTTIDYRGTTLTTLLTAEAGSGSGGAGGAASAATSFANTGFFASTPGQNGSSGVVSASTSTFLSGGGLTAGTQTANYGYSLTSASESIFMTQPIIVGGAISSSTVKNGAIGCGGSGNAGSRGGRGLVIIASW